MKKFLFEATYFRRTFTLQRDKFFNIDKHFFVSFKLKIGRNNFRSEMHDMGIKCEMGIGYFMDYSKSI